MKSVSNAYKASMKAMLRNRSYVRITFGNVDTTAATDGEWESNGAASISEFETVDYAYQYGDTYVSLELNRWALDGKSLLVPTGEDVQDGFISSLMSDAEGNFTTPPVITREFSLKHIFPGLTLTFDTRQQEWPLEVTADFYLNGAVVDTQTVAITSVQTTISTTATEVDKVTITFDRCLPYRRPRLENVLYGLNVQFVNKDIVSTQQKHDVDPLSRRLPTETMQFTILDYEHKYDPDNPAGIYAYVDKNSPIEIQFGYELPDGSVEWIKPDNYVLNAKPSAQDNQATFNGPGMIGSLTRTFYKSKLGSKSLYDMAQEVLLDAGLTLTEQGENPWEIDDALKDMFTTAALPIDTHMNCLQLIAHAACCRLYTDDDNIIHIRPFGVTVIGIYNGVWADNGHVWFSEWDTIDKGNTAENTYVTFELNRWTLGGESQIILPDSNAGQRGYISEAMTGADGSFTNPPVFTKTFDVPHDLPVLAIRFDTVLDEFPGAVQVKYYHDDTLLDTQTATIDSVEVYVSSNLAIECTKIEVTMIGNLPYRRGRVTKIYYRETDFTLDFTSIGENSQKISKIDELKSVSVTRYSYTASNDTSTLYEGTTTETELHVEFSGLAQDVQISVSGGTLVSSNIYARAADLVLSSGTKTVTITGKTLTENSVVVSYPVAQSGEIDKEENPLITNDTMCQALANHVKSYLQMRNTYEANYRGNPEMEVGDIIGLQTLYTDEMDALILVDEITFDGSLSGKMTVKGLI